MDQQQGNLPLVLDMGHTMFRLGYSGDDSPKIETDNYYALNTYSHNSPIENAGDSASNPTQQTFLFMDSLHRYNPNYRYLPIKAQNSSVPDKNFGQFFTDQVLSQLSLEPTSPIIASESNTPSKEDRLFMLQTFLEGNLCPSLFLLRHSQMSLYSCGKTNGAILDSSSYVTSLSTIEEGYFVPEGYSQISFGGETITGKIMEYFNKDYSNTLPEHVVNSGLDLNLLDESYFQYERTLFSRKVKKALLSAEGTQTTKYTLPDNSSFTLSSEIASLAQNIFMLRPPKSSRSQLADLMATSIQKTIDNKNDAKIFSSYILTGGNASLQGFIEGTKTAIADVNAQFSMSSKLFSFHNSKIRNLSVWIGGSIVGSIDSLISCFITKSELAEFGDSVIDRKLL